MSYKAVVFDFGGVIMNYSCLGRASQEKGTKTDTDPTKLQSEMRKQAVAVSRMQHLMKGLITAEEVKDQLAKHFPGASSQGGRLFSAWTAPGSKIIYNDGYLEAIERLRLLGYKVILLTNNFFFDKDRKLERTSIDRSLFDLIVESALEGEMKPERPIYEITQTRIEELDSIHPSEVVFLDDLEENLRVPEEMGWTTIRVDPNQPHSGLKNLEAILNVSLID